VNFWIHIVEFSLLLLHFYPLDKLKVIYDSPKMKNKVSYIIKNERKQFWNLLPINSSFGMFNVLNVYFEYICFIPRIAVE